MEKYLIVVYFIFLPIICFAQPQPAIVSLKNYGGNYVDGFTTTGAVRTTDGGFIVNLYSNSSPSTGNLDSFCSITGKRNIFIKFNADASGIEWTKCYGADPLQDSVVFLYLFPQSNGDKVLVAVFTGGGGVYVTRRTASDAIVWQKSYSKGNNAGIYSAITTADGGYLIACNANYMDSNVTVHYGNWTVPDVWLLKLDSLGNKEWSKVFGGSSDDLPGSIIEVADGYLMVGSTNSEDVDAISSHGNGDGLIIKLDKNGNKLWSKCYGGTGGEGFTRGIAGRYNGILVAGETNSNNGDVQHHITGTNFWLASIDNAGNIIWENCFGGGGQERCRVLCQSTDGTLWLGGSAEIIGGQVYTTYGHVDGFIIHADSLGQFISSKVVGSSDNDDYSFIEALPNGFVVAGGVRTNPDGFFNGVGQWADAFLIRFAPWTTSIQSIVNDKDFKVFPNPVKDMLQIEFTESAPREIAIRNVVGQEIFRKSTKCRNMKINTTGWELGVYYVCVFDRVVGYPAKKVVIE